MNFKKKFFKNTFILAIYNYSTQFIEFLSTYILSRLLLPEEYGFVALITVFTGFVSIFVDAGLSYAIIRSDYGERYFKAISNLSLLIGVILFLVMALLAYPIAIFYDNKELIIPTLFLGSNLIIRSVSVVPSAILNKNLEFNKIGLTKFLGSVLQIGLTIFLAYLGFSYWALIVPVIIHAVFSNLMYSIMARFRFRFFPLIYLRLAFRTTKRLMANITGFNLIGYWARNADNLVIGKFYGTADLGIYNRAYRLLTMAIGSTTNLFGQVLFPSLKELKSKGGDVKGEFSSMLGIISIISFPIGAFMILFADPFVHFMWGEKWMAVAGLLPYFGIMILVQTLLSTLGNIYILFEEERMLFKIGVASAAIIIISILAGATFSMLHVARFYTISFIAFSVPVNLYYGFIRTLKYKVSDVLKFWIPKMILLSLAFVFIWIDRYDYTAISVGMYLLHILHLQRKDIRKVYLLIKSKIGSYSGSVS